MDDRQFETLLSVAEKRVTSLWDRLQSLDAEPDDKKYAGHIAGIAGAWPSMQDSVERLTAARNAMTPKQRTASDEALKKLGDIINASRDVTRGKTKPQASPDRVSEPDGAPPAAPKLPLSLIFAVEFRSLEAAEAELFACQDDYYVGAPPDEARKRPVLAFATYAGCEAFLRGVRVSTPGWPVEYAQTVCLAGPLVSVSTEQPVKGTVGVTSRGLARGYDKIYALADKEGWLALASAIEPATLGFPVFTRPADAGAALACFYKQEMEKQGMRIVVAADSGGGVGYEPDVTEKPSIGPVDVELGPLDFKPRTEEEENEFRNQWLAQYRIDKKAFNAALAGDKPTLRMRAAVYLLPLWARTMTPDEAAMQSLKYADALIEADRRTAVRGVS